MSVRSAVALQQGVDEELLAKVDTYETSDLSEMRKATLRLSDAYLTSPADISDDVKRSALEHLTTPQIVETVLHLMQYSSDKIMVALGLDLEEIRIMSFGRSALENAADTTKTSTSA
jgi:hypothetical protein